MGDITHTHIHYIHAETEEINWELIHLNCILATSQVEGGWGEKRKIRKLYKLKVYGQKKIRKIKS
jgi:hypothetical protein